MNHSCKSFTFVVIAILLAVTACKKKEYQTIEELDQENIQNYIQRNNLDVQPFGETGMYYQVLEEGTGEALDYTKKTALVYTLKTLDDSFISTDTFNVSNRYYDYLGYFPYGSTQANAPGSPLDKEEGMKVLLEKVLKNANGKIRVIVPSRLAFGRNGNKFIPPNASIDYVIHPIDTANMAMYSDESIKKYIQSAGLELGDFQKTPSGVYYKITEPGSGESISDTTSFKASYTMKLLSGTTVSTADSASLKVNNTIKGWKDVIPQLKENGKARIIIPSTMAYGLGSVVDDNNVTRIPPFSPLDYDIHIVEVTKPAP